MKRTLLMAGLVAMVATASTIFVGRATNAAKQTTTKERPQQAVAESEKKSDLPIAQVVLFSSGVGYFQREGQVDGNARVDLTFPTEDINDLIKSMTVQDLSGGQVGTISYDSLTPVERTLQSFAINLNGNPSFGDILHQARGEKIEVVLQQANAQQPGTLTGTIVGIERKTKAVGQENVVESRQLNLWCADGVRSFALSEVQRVRFLNPIMESEFRQALETLALSRDTQKKAVSLHFTGEGKRKVRVGYVVENPMWKTSYRLVLDKQKKDKPYLQGWAIVENPSDEDWKGVNMALISGRPISFKMDLYSQLFVPRPTVVPELFAGLKPVAYNSAIGGEINNPSTQAVDSGLFPHARPELSSPMAITGESVAVRGFVDVDGSVIGPLPKMNPAAMKQRLEEKLTLADSVHSMASASKLGDFFQYTIDRPVNLSRQKSAMLPIVDKNIDATRLSIYNENTQAKFPLLGLRLKNTSGLHLMQGPITVFEGSLYAGDARILDLQPDEERLISYAVDLGTEVTPVPHAANGKLTQVKIVKGLVYTTTKIRESKDYTITNRNDAERLVLLEHPVRHNFELIDTDKPVETASDVYRFELKVPAGKSKTQTITEEQIVTSTVQFSNTDDRQIKVFLNSTVVSDDVKSALQSTQQKRWKIAETQREIGELQRQLQTIVTDQTRLRENLKAMPTNAKAYQRYLDKFDTQETQIEDYQAKIKKLQGVEHTQQKEFEDFLAALTVE